MEEFNLHFYPAEKYIPIHWLGTEREIIYLFQKIKVKPNNNIYKTISNHFINIKGKPFKVKQLRVTNIDLLVNYPKIDSIIENLSE